jgi:hypothetical protein
MLEFCSEVGSVQIIAGFSFDDTLLADHSGFLSGLVDVICMEVDFLHE